MHELSSEKKASSLHPELQNETRQSYNHLSFKLQIAEAEISTVRKGESLP